MASTISYGQDSLSLNTRHKRRGVALSCAECRRLKLKCSRIFPCSNCVKKGCSAICPEGSLTTGKGNRFVLANTEALHDKINELSNRVRHLEDALAQSHAQNSTYPHPLLAEELLQIKRPLERERMDVSPAVKEEESETNDTIDSIGSLSISYGGRSTFYGQTANSWYLLQNEEGAEEEDDRPVQQPMPLDVAWLNHTFPFAPPVSNTGQGVRDSIIDLLPSNVLARKLCDIYFRHAAWMYTPITETDFYETIFVPIYEQEAAYHGSAGSHRLAVLFIVLALGTLLDLERPAHSPESKQFYQLGRAALALDSVLDEQSFLAIQAMLLMSHFLFLSEVAGPRWVIMGMVVKLAQSIGLHRDSGRWKLEKYETQRRRELFYELLTYDSWQSLTFGRPPSLSKSHIDCVLPHDTFISATGDVEMSFPAWKHRFTYECLSNVHDQAFGARTPNYKVIQELDKKVRSYYVPPSLQVPGFGGSKVGAEVERPTVELTMQRYITFAIKEITLFYMHRGYFAQALEDSPTDPMGSKFAPSVLAAYSSACSFVGLIESLFKQHPGLTERMWFLFTHVFSCSIVLGSIAVKSQMALAPSALTHLESAYNLFSRVSDPTRTGRILPILRKLRDRAHATLAISQSQHIDATTRLSMSSGPQVKTETDELSALGGMTRLVERRASASPSYAGSSPASQSESPQIPPPQAHHSQHSFTEAGHTWQNYGTVQQSYSDQYHMQQAHSQIDTSMMYSGQQQGTPLEATHGYYGYSPQSGYGGMQIAAQSPDITSSPNHHYLPADSWHNLIAQFKH